MWDHADLDEVRQECRAQIERAILWGFDVSHLDSHLGAMALRPEFFDIYLEMAVDYRLPIRLSDESTERAIGFPFRRLAAEEHVVFPDHLVQLPAVGSRRIVEKALFELQPGVTEIYLHPAADTPELRALDAGLGQPRRRPPPRRPRRRVQGAAHPQRRHAHRLPRAARADARRLSVTDRGVRPTGPDGAAGSGGRRG